METMLEIFCFFLVFGAMAFIVALMSKEREIGFWTLFAISLFLTPFVGVFAALLSRKKRGAGAGVQVGGEEIKETQSKFWERFTPKKDGE
jgi:hypothetical protein